MPECRSRVGPWIVTSSPTSPRSCVTMAGTRSAKSPVSQISAISAVRRSLLACRNGTSEGDPDSSSPSKKMVMRPGRVPWTVFQARQASTKVISWPLSSDAPRARITRPFGVSSIAGSNGGRVHRCSGSAGCTS